jgi:hypothetical protein
MSGPKVLTWEPAENIEEAREANSRDAALYLAILRETCDRVRERLRRLKERGQPVPDFPFDYGEIAANVNRLLQVAGGSSGLKLAHEMVQKAKHPLAEIIDRQYLAWEAKEEELSRDSTRRAAEHLVQSFRAYDVKRVVANTPPALQAEIDRELVAIATCALHDDPAALVEQVQRTLASTVPAQILAALRAHRLTLEERALTRRTERVTERLLAEQRAAFQTEVEAQITLARSELTILEQDRERAFVDELERLRAETPQLSQQRFYAHFEEIRRRITAERQRHAMISLVQTVLQRHGYQEIDAMETITPEQIRNRRARTLYFRDGEDANRFVELAFAEKDAFSLEVVRADDTGDSSDEARDRGAQVRLCDVLAQIKQNAGETYQLKALREDPVGTPISTRRSLRPHAKRSASVSQKAFKP